MNRPLLALLPETRQETEARTAGDTNPWEDDPMTATIPEMPGTRPVMKPDGPGFYPGVNALDYHRWPGASQSRLKILRDQSPAHLKWAMGHPEEPTDAMRLGAAVHTCVLEPDRFAILYVRAPEGDGRTKAVKEERAKLATERPDVIILRREDYDTCQAIRRTVAEHPLTKHLLNGDREASAVWTDPETGVLCRGRFDALARGVGAITDLKTANDASPHRFPMSVYQFGYALQGAHYLRGARTLGIEVDSFSIVAVEKEPPYVVAVYQLHAAAIHDAERELDALLALWARCEASGEWPGYGTEAVTIDLPSFAPRQITDRIGIYERL